MSQPATDGRLAVVMITYNRCPEVLRSLEQLARPAEPRMPGRPLLGFFAGASVIRRSAFFEVGGYDERYFIGGEEQLLAWDLAARGYWLCYVPEVVVHHHPSPQRDGQTRRWHSL